MTKEKLLLELVTILDAFEKELNRWKDNGNKGSGILTEEFLDTELSLIFSLIHKVSGTDENNDSIGEILFNDKLTSARKVESVLRLV